MMVAEAIWDMEQMIINGVRVTRYSCYSGSCSDHAVVTVPIDFTNKAPSSGIYHFGKISKLQYSNGAALRPVQEVILLKIRDRVFHKLSALKELITLML